QARARVAPARAARREGVAPPSLARFGLRLARALHGPPRPASLDVHRGVPRALSTSRREHEPLRNGPARLRHDAVRPDHAGALPLGSGVPTADDEPGPARVIDSASCAAI